jgi:hypothetical protein
MGIQPIESELHWQRAPVLAKLSDQHLPFSRSARFGLSPTDPLNFDAVPLFDFECFDHWRR